MIRVVFSLFLLGVVLINGGCRHFSPPIDQTENASTLPTSTPTLKPPVISTPTLPPTITPTPSITPLPTITSTPTPTPSPTPIPPEQLVNNIPINEIILLSPDVVAHIREVYQLGQQLERNPQAFSRVGDSLIAVPDFLTPFDNEPYQLGIYSYLQPTIDFFAGSFARYGVALRSGVTAAGTLDPLWADKDWCLPNEGMVACEIRLHDPSILLIQLGTNDVSPSFGMFMRDLVEYCLENGVIPVLITKADRFLQPDNLNNQILYQIAADLQVPLVDFDHVAETMPNKGLREDNVHLTQFAPYDYTLPEAMGHGHIVHNLVVLMMLDQIRQKVLLP